MSSVELPDQTEVNPSMIPGWAAQLIDKLINHTHVRCTMEKRTNL